MKYITLLFSLMTALTACTSPERGERIPPISPFDDDVAFLRKYSTVTELRDSRNRSRIAVMAGLQGRVMTSTAGPPENLSYGWINRALFESGDTSTHMNAFGGEERLWLGPEGGQFSIFFPPDSAFTFENWHTPRLIDLDSYEIVSQTNSSASFVKSATITNYSGTEFHIRIHREVKILETPEAFSVLGQPADSSLSCVAYQTVNRLENVGATAWEKRSGLLSIWLLGMFNPSPGVTVVIPYNEGPVQGLGPVVNDDYFGKVPADRLKISDGVIYFKGDGQYRSKIGLSPARAQDVMGSFDEQTGTLTIVRYSKGEAGDDYVNSKWEIQRDPYSGDVTNAYNDGPPSPGAPPMGPFYELESSSPARELQPGESLEHVQTTFHFQGELKYLDSLAGRVLGVSLGRVRAAFPAQGR